MFTTAFAFWGKIVQIIINLFGAPYFLGGIFTIYKPENTIRIGRLNANGIGDISFNIGAGFNNNVNFVAIQSDGRILVGGAFTTYQSLSVNRIVRLNADGSIDASFNMGTGFSGTVNSIAIQSDGRILVGGDFTTYQSLSANRIIRLNADGSRDTSFNIGTGFSGTVVYIAIQSDGRILVGGSFTSYQSVASSRIIRLNADGLRDTSFNIGTGFNNTVFYIAIQSDGRILVGGSFTSYQSVASSRIIRLNAGGLRDTSFNIGTGFSSTVIFIAIQSDKKVICGGSFTAYQGVSANRIVRLNTDGSIDASFNIGTGLDNTVNSIAIQSDGRILVVGVFTTYQGISANRIIRLNADGSIDSTFFVGIGFSNAVRTIVIQSDGKLLCGGLFIRYQGQPVNRIIKLNSNSTIDDSFNVGSGFNNTVDSIAVQLDGKVICGGSFTAYQGVSANRIVRLNTDGSIDASFNMGTGFSGTVNCIVIQSDGKILVCGGFTAYQGVSANYIIRLNTDGSRDASFNMGTGFSIIANYIAIQSGGRILVGGVFTSYQSVASNRIIRLNADGSRDTSFNIGTGFNNAVNVVATQSDGKVLAGGFFTSYQGISANRIIRLNADGSIDASFNIGAGFNNNVNFVAIQSDGRILVGGAFTTYQSLSANRIIRLNTDGSIDASFNIGTGLDNTVNYIVIQSDGKILVGGGFTTYQGLTAGKIIRLNIDGSIDTTFDIRAGFDDAVRSIGLTKLN